MEIQTKHQTTINPALSKSKAAQAEQPKLSAYQQTKKMQDVAILNASTNNSAANNPMQLLYKTAIDEINKQLAPIFGENATQAAYESNLDISPEATAQRIVQGSTAFYDAFKTKNSELGDKESVNQFLDIISSGINKGFEEAKEILDSLSVLEGDIATNIDLTYDFVQQSLTSFKEQLLASFTDKNASNEDSVEK